jgi:hypothetical protein
MLHPPGSDYIFKTEYDFAITGIDRLKTIRSLSQQIIIKNQHLLNLNLFLAKVKTQQN